MPRFNRRVFVMRMISQAATATVACKMLSAQGSWGQNTLRGAVQRELTGDNAGAALSRMQSWLLGAEGFVPAKDERLLMQIERVHAWVRSAFLLESDAVHSASAGGGAQAPRQPLVIAAGKPLSLRLPESGRHLEAFVQVNHGAAPGSGAVLVAQANGREIFRSGTLNAGRPPVLIQVALEKTREFSLSVVRPTGKIFAGILNLSLSKVTLTNGRVLPLGKPFGVPGCTELSAAATPFSFQYGGRDAQTELISWRRQLRVRDEAAWTRYEISYTDPVTQLEVLCDLKVFKTFPAVHWLLRLTNHGPTDTPLLENILPLDLNLVLPEEGDFTLHHSNGSTMSATDFMPMERFIRANDRIVLAPNGGRSSDSVLPFFNLQWRGGGMVGAIGWTGQWSMCLQNDRNRCAALQAGQQTTRLKLHPGESIRTPSIALVPWQGDSVASGNNLLRRLLLAHFVARIENKIAMPPVAMWQLSFVVGVGQTLNDVNENNQLRAIKQIAENRFGTEVFWLDAGWMAGGGWWGGVGNWTADKRKFPNGLRPVADAANKHGMQFLLWFEPERVIAKTQVAEEHPEWVMRNATFGIQGLFALGNPDARRWMTRLLANRIRQWNVGILRHDFNITPLPFWQQADKPDRQGITEIRYIEGLYAMWDELRCRFPLLAIDCCASGGRRIDLESIQRCFYLWRSDVMCSGQPDATWCQTESAGLNKYVPTNGGATGNANVDVYDFRSTATAGVILYIPQTPQQVSLIREAIAELKMLRPLYLGDYYPLTPIGNDNTQWEAWQFDRPEMGMGFVMYFRRPKNADSVAHFELQNLNPDALYKVAWKGSTYKFEGARVMTGRELTFISATIKEPRSTGLLIYHRTKS